MRKCVGISLGLCLLASIGFAQGDRGLITGVVIDSDGNAVEGATVNAKNVATGAIVSAVSSAKGSFTISGLAAGTYPQFLIDFEAGISFVELQPVISTDVCPS